MAIFHVSLTASGDTTNDPCTTASIDPAGQPILIFVGLTQTTTGPRVPTLTVNTGSGTFTALSVGSSIDAATGKGMFAFCGTNLTAATTITITRNASDSAILSVVWTVLKMIGASHVPGLWQGAVQSDSDWDLADTQTATFGTTPKTNSKIYAGATTNVTTDTIVVGAGLTEIEQHSVASASIELKTSYCAGATQSTVAYTQSSGDNLAGAVIGIEVPARTGSVQTLTGVGY